eukprot:Opistho-2@36690
MNFILLIAFGVSVGVGDYAEATVVAIVIVTNTIIGFFQEYRSERTMEALRKLSSPTARILRDGELAIDLAPEIVPGDIIYLEEGDQVAADIRLLTSVNLEIDEILLTGESMPVKKSPTVLPNPDVPLGDRTNLAYKNTIVTKGRGHGVVIATGMSTEIGLIAASVSSKGSGAQKTHLQRRMERLMFVLLGVACVLAFIVFATNRFSGNNQVILYALAVAIAILPEGLPAVVTVTMAVGVRKMARQKAIVRKLASLETLGEVTNICSDKTGTITVGKMVATNFVLAAHAYSITGAGLEPVGTILIDPSSSGSGAGVGAGGHVVDYNAMPDHLSKALVTCALCNTSSIIFQDDRWQSVGDPTEVALQVLATKAGLGKPSLSPAMFEFVSEQPFDAVLKRMTVVYRALAGNAHAPAGSFGVFMKGSIEAVTACATKCVARDGSIVPITKERVDEILNEMEGLASRGLRVLALAYRVIPQDDPAAAIAAQPDDSHRTEIEADMTVVGIVGMYDPPRADSAEAVERCHRAGICVHMATGDHPKTAAAIARQVNIITAEDERLPNVVMVATEFDRMSDEELDALPELPRVLARCSPKSKVKLIEALHRRGKHVAMTGDGVNDAPAVKNADVGIAMGFGGSDVTKQASDIVLTDDNFATILKAVGEGRRLFSNIAKFVVHLLSGNVSEVVLLILALGFQHDGLSVFAMSPIQILWLNMVTSSPPSLGLGMEPASPDILIIPPRARNVGLFTKEVILDFLMYGGVMGILTLASFAVVVYGVGNGIEGADCNNKYSSECDNVFRGRTVTFVQLSLMLLILAYACRHERKSMLRMRWRDNKVLAWTLLFGVVTTIPTPYIPYLNKSILHQAPITWEWGLIAGNLLFFVVAIELYKLAKRRIWGYAKELDKVATADDFGKAALSRATNEALSLSTAGPKANRAVLQ